MNDFRTLRSGGKKVRISKIGGSSDRDSHEKRPPTQVVVTLPFLLRRPFKDKNFLHQKYAIEGLSIAQISTEIGSSKEAVRNGLRRFDIDVRASGQHHGRPSQPRFGVKIRHGRSVDHEFEQGVIKSVHQLKSQGLSLRKIAQTLTGLDIPTKKRGQAWHPEMVSRILCQK